MADLTFVSRRDSSFKEFPPASAQIAMVLPFFGNLTVWMRTPDAGGWHFPTTARVYMCELDRLSWWYELPDKEKSAELGVFARLPRPIASEAVEIVLEAALRARRTGLR